MSKVVYLPYSYLNSQVLGNGGNLGLDDTTVWPDNAMG